MQFEVTIEKFLSLILPAIAFLIWGWRIKRAEVKKTEAVTNQEIAKARKDEIELSKSVQDLYNSFLEHDKIRTDRIEKQINEYLKSIDELKDIVANVQLANAILEERLQEREKQYKKLEAEYKELKIKYAEIKKELEKHIRNNEDNR